MGAVVESIFDRPRSNTATPSAEVPPLPNTPEALDWPMLPSPPVVMLLMVLNLVPLIFMQEPPTYTMSPCFTVPDVISKA